MANIRITWNADVINGHFYSRLNKLRRVPTAQELEGGLLHAISREKIPSVRTWNEFLKYHGFEPNREPAQWTAEIINGLFYEKLNELRRVPTNKEFNRGAMHAMSGGAIPGVKTWNQFLKYQGFEPNKEQYKWTAERINEEFYNLLNELRKVPTYNDLNSGLIEAIARETIPGIKTHNQFLQHHGFEPNRELCKQKPTLLGEVLGD